MAIGGFLSWEPGAGIEVPVIGVGLLYHSSYSGTSGRALPWFLYPSDHLVPLVLCPFLNTCVCVYHMACLRNWSYDMVSTCLWDHLREVYQRHSSLLSGLAEGNTSYPLPSNSIGPHPHPHLIVQHSSAHSHCAHGVVAHTL